MTDDSDDTIAERLSSETIIKITDLALIRCSTGTYHNDPGGIYYGVSAICIFYLRKLRLRGCNQSRSMCKLRKKNRVCLPATSVLLATSHPSDLNAREAGEVFTTRELGWLCCGCHCLRCWEYSGLWEKATLSWGVGEDFPLCWVLKERLANCSMRTESDLLTRFVNKVLLQHTTPLIYLLSVCYSNKVEYLLYSSSRKSIPDSPQFVCELPRRLIKY